MNDPILMYGDEPIGQLYKNSKAQSTSIARVVTNPLTGDGISQGSGFMLDGKRCVALINIATGTTMVEHTHYEYESVEEKINEVASNQEVDVGITYESGITEAKKRINKQGNLYVMQLEFYWDNSNTNEKKVITFSNFSAHDYLTGTVVDSDTKTIGSFILSGSMLYIRLNQTVASTKRICLTIVGFNFA